MSDNVNHPDHYTGFSNGSEVIDITENLSFNLGNVVKYVARSGRKTEDPLEDLFKAEFYLRREIARLVPAPPTFADEVADRIGGWGPRQWSLLDHVPPHTIVQDTEGDQYVRINGTSQFKIRWDNDSEWDDVTPYIYRDQAKYAPFTEVSNSE